MRKSMIRAIYFAAALAAVCIGGCDAASAKNRAYLFRGLIGAIDWGMDQLADRVSHAGVATYIDSHLTWRTAAEQAIADYKRDPGPITAIGHSIGGDSAVNFAEALNAAHVPVALLITYDPTRGADRIPANVHRYINLYQSSNFLGGGDLGPGPGFHGHYASYNLKDRTEIIHVNLDKFSRIQELLASKIRSAGAGGEGEAVPLRLVPPATGPIELWDSGMAVTAHAGDTLQSVATQYHVPIWALQQTGPKAGATLNEGERVVVPRYLGGAPAASH
jgi:thioesterase domain-containing protein